MLTSFAPDIWIADGPPVIAHAGFHYPLRMAVIRLSDGGLFIWSPIPLTEELRREVDALGTVSHIIAPNALHHLSIPDWKAAYPQAKLYAAPGLSKKRKDISFDAGLGDTPPPAWAKDIDQVLLENTITSEVVFFHKASGTAIFTDILQQFSPGWFSGWRGIVAKLDLMVGPEPSVPRKFRMGFRKKDEARNAVRRILDWPVEKVLLAHGAPITSEGKTFLARAFQWLKV